MKFSKSLLIVPVLAGAVALAGCDTSSTDALTASITNYTKLACSFEPTATTISTILTKVDPTASATNAVAKEVADAICAQVKPSAGKKGVSKPTVEGVVVDGKYVKPTDKVS